MRQFSLLEACRLSGLLLCAALMDGCNNNIRVQRGGESIGSAQDSAGGGEGQVETTPDPSPGEDGGAETTASRARGEPILYPDALGEQRTYFQSTATIVIDVPGDFLDVESAFFVTNMTLSNHVLDDSDIEDLAAVGTSTRIKIVPAQVVALATKLGIGQQVIRIATDSEDTETQEQYLEHSINRGDFTVFAASTAVSVGETDDREFLMGPTAFEGSVLSNGAGYLTLGRADLLTH